MGYSSSQLINQSSYAVKTAVLSDKKRSTTGMHVVCWVVVLSLRVAQVQAGTDGAMGYFFEQQLVTGTAAELAQGALPVAIDAAGKLFPAVLKVGPLVHRGKAATSHYLEVYKWIAGFVSLGVPVLLVFDTLTGRYPPKAGTHAKRAAATKKHRDRAAALDAAHVSGVDPDADGKWAQVLDRETYRDLVHFTTQLCTALTIKWVVAPFEADLCVCKLKIISLPARAGDMHMCVDGSAIHVVCSLYVWVGCS